MNTGNEAFYFFSTRYATRFHISRLLKERGWKELHSSIGASFTDDNLILNDEVSKNFEYKHLLAQLVSNDCPHLMPKTYCIDDDTAEQVLAKIFYENYLMGEKAKHAGDGLKWILKPSLLNNADNIHLFNDVDELKQHYKSPKRLGGPHVIQKYIDNPDLIDGRKYTFRLHVILTNYDGVFMMKDGYVNISEKQYSRTDRFADKKVHITNYVLDGEFSNIQQRLISSLPDFLLIYKQMEYIVKTMILSLVKKYPSYLIPKKIKAFELFGFDFILDSNKKLWLLEINQAPDAPTFEENWLNEPFWQPFWSNIVDEFVIPIAFNTNPKNNYHYYHHVLKSTQVMNLWTRIKRLFI